ncbi:MAG TPA: DUF58 domain-containing protein, partial [Sulfurimonas sp.]|nr:DUF58 domain-containing protein [Sulfurimonas sp.]
VFEVKEKKLISRAFIPYLPPYEKITIYCDTPYEQRGIYTWDRIAFGTRYPFGFAQKLRLIDSPGLRLVWPRRKGMRTKKNASIVQANDHFQMAQASNESMRGKLGSGSLTEGEIREYVPGDDLRYVSWTHSAMRGIPVVRTRRAGSEKQDLLLDTRVDQDEFFENTIARLAQSFYSASGSSVIDQNDQQSQMTVIDWSGSTTVKGARNCLDALSRVEAAGKYRRE